MTIAAGQIVTADDLTPVHHRCRAYPSGNQSTSGSTVVVALGAEDYDTSSMHDTATNNSRIVAPVAGYYVVQAQVTWAANSTSRRLLALRANASGNSAAGTQLALSTGQAMTTGAMSLQIYWEGPLSISDYVELFALQDSGGSLNILAGVSTTWLSMRFVPGA